MISYLKDKVANRYQNFVAYKKLNILKDKKSKNKRIRVGFIVQMPQIWDKQEPVFREMLHDEKFEPKLIVTPMFDYVNMRVCEFGEEKAYFEQRYGMDLCIFYDDSFDVNSLKEYDYIFFPRPYDCYLPEDLRSYKVINFTKTVYIPYAYSASEAFNKLDTSEEFYRYIYLGFVDIEGELDILTKRHKKNIVKGLQSFHKLGYPSFEKYLDCNDGRYESRVLWTPRWTTDEVLGGSHFLEYKDEFISLKDDLKECKLRLRPHPLMFSNFLNKGILSEKEIDDYKKALKSNDIELSDNMMLWDDFNNTDVLLTDHSSIVIEFFLTGKPIIYCPPAYELNKEYKTILEGLYIANSWSDVVGIMEQLLSGQDPLKKKREEIIKNSYSDVKGAAKRIVECIKEDYIS